MKLLKKIWGNQQVVYWVFLVMLILPNLFMFFTESTSLFTRVVNVLLPFACYRILLTLCGKPGKMFWWLFLFIFFAAFQIVLLYLFGESPIAVDMFLNVVTTNVTEADELLFQIYPAVVFVFVIYGGGIALSFCSIANRALLRPSFAVRQRILGTIWLGVVLLALLVAGFRQGGWPVSFRNDIFPVNVTYNLGLSVQRYVQSARYAHTSGHFSHQAQYHRADSLPEVYVLVIGETLRADNLGIYGYERNTTPRLAALADSLVVYPDAITMSNTTHKSVPLLLTAVGSELCYDSLYTQRGLISAFAEAGFATSFFSNQRRNGSFIDFLGSEAQEVKFTKDGLRLDANVYDEELLSLLDKSLHSAAAGRQLIVLHCYGSHFDYRDRCPDSLWRFAPTQFPSAKKEYRPQLVNAYDNTVQYADALLARVIGMLQACGRPAVMLYTSDHGEDIYDDARARFLHASPIPTYYQLHVPLIAWASASWRESYPEKWENLRTHASQPVSTGMVMFHTLLDLAGIETRLTKPSLALGNDRFVPTQRLYVNDHNELRTLDDCGLKPADEQLFRSHHLQFP
ncbi:MAG: phosphoethanolamine transferase [Muribaculaceae bacterium]|nr:phosphoethanolamine transferase [Muribaculaceae bacterium]